MASLDNLKPFEKGKSGNPKGRPKLDPQIKELARAASVEAIERAIKLIHSADENVSLKAINTVLDRGWGKPMQAHELTGADGGPIEHDHSITVNFVRPKAD